MTYALDTDSQARYPLMNPNSWEPYNRPYNTLKATRKPEPPNKLEDSSLPPYPLITVTLLNVISISF
ncbi:MAG: hypothetical protein ACUVTE_07025 [Candidatus Bathycorpusculaceae bacterium]